MSREEALKALERISNRVNCSLFEDDFDIISQALQDPWQDISTAPRDGTEILILSYPRNSYDGEHYIVASHDESNTTEAYWDTLDYSYHKDFATHWMPIPEFKGE